MFEKIVKRLAKRLEEFDERTKRDYELIGKSFYDEMAVGLIWFFLGPVLMFGGLGLAILIGPVFSVGSVIFLIGAAITLRGCIQELIDKRKIKKAKRGEQDVGRV